ncbi:MAG: hypothetical protein KF708_14880 [Pirellulales bacterium]|nr:hypothetical protein [Pirellulales bacterium]
MATQHTDQYREVLDEFERVLLTPLVSGELPGWVENALRAYQAAAPPLRERVEVEHSRELGQIFQEDPELATEVEKMRHTDHELLAALERIGQALGRLCQVAPRVEPNEAPAAEVLGRISEQGIALVIAFRRQEEALRLWHNEALLRDRGAAD